MKRLNRSRGNVSIKCVLLDDVESKKSRWNFNLAAVKLVLSYNPRNLPARLGANVKTGPSKAYFT